MSASSPNAPSAVVMLHSGGMSSRQWRRLADVLSASHRVITPDFLGIGENPPWPEEQPFHFTMDVEHIETVIDTLGAPVHLVGHSYGGFVALTLARRSPAKIRSLSVYDPVAFGVLHAAGDEEGLADLRRAEDSSVFRDEKTGGQEPWLEAFIDYWNGPGAWKLLPEGTRQAFLRVGRKVFFEVSSLMADRTPASAYAVIEAPSLLLGGALSPAAARRVNALLAAAMPRATERAIASAGHMGPLTHGVEVNDAIAAHVRASDVSAQR